MNELKVGDVVVLKSGGPSMSVYQIGDDVSCKWFDGNELKYGGFIKEVLELKE